MVKSQRIFIADDSVYDFALLSAALKESGADSIPIVHSADGETALEMLKSDPNYSLVILDHYLPRLTGADIIEHLGSTIAELNCPIVILSSSSLAPEQEARYRKTGTSLIMEKPSDLDGFTRLATGLVELLNDGTGTASAGK